MLRSRFVQIIVGILVIAVAALTYWYFSPNGPGGSDTSQAMIEVVLPESLSAREKQGGDLFDEYCASCHGANAAGSDEGPPLVHRIYEPGHHGDESFVLAAERGVRSHHWKFGDMPIREGVTRAEVGVIVSYVRVLQRANGIQ